MTKLYVLSGRGKDRSVDYNNDAIFIGRSFHNDIQTRDRFVSRTHLKIFKKGDKFFIKDLGSRNGTYVNGKKIVPALPFQIEKDLPIVIGMNVICLSERPTEIVLPLMHSIDPVQIIRKQGAGVSDGRPMTSENNMALISKVAGLLMKPLGLREILDKTLSHTLNLLKRVDRAVVILVDRETGEIFEIISKFQTGIKRPYAMCGRTIVDRVAQTGTAVVMTDIQKEGFDDFSETMKLRNVRSVACLPLMSKSQVRGVLYLDSNRVPNAFRGDDLSLLTALGSSAAMAMENASLVSNE